MYFYKGERGKNLIMSKIFSKFLFISFFMFLGGYSFAATITCNAAQYYDGTNCTGCPAGYYCPGVRANTNKGVQGLNICTANSYCQAWSSSPTLCTAQDPDYPNSPAGSDYFTDCYTICSPGYYVPWYGSPCVACPLGTYGVATSTQVNLSASTSCTNCPNGYDDGGPASTAQNQCKLLTNPGTYLATANGTTLTTCTSGYYCPAELITYGATNTMTQCTVGSGSPLGSASAADCGVRLQSNWGAETWLKSARQTTPALNVFLDGVNYYGNLTTTYNGRFRVNHNGTTYYLY